MLGLRALSAPSQGSKAGKGGNNKKKGKGKGKSGSSCNQAVQRISITLRSCLSIVEVTSMSVSKKKKKKSFANPFKKGTCKNGHSCTFAHICVGCGRSKPFVERRCLTSKILRISEKVAEDSLPSSVSSAVPLVKPESGPKRVLLLASETVFESEARAALENQPRIKESSVCFELMYLDLTPVIDFFAVL